MAIKFLDAIDLTGLEIQNVLAQNAAGNPATPLGEGQFFYDSTAGVKALKYYNGTAWVTLDGQGGVTSLLDGVGTLVSSATGSISVNLNLAGLSNYVLEGQDLTGTEIDGKGKIPFSDASNDVSFALVSELPFTANLGTVTNVTAGNTTFIDGSSTGGTTPAITMELSATGTASATTYLRGDNSWATIAAGYSKWLLDTDSSGTTFDVVEGATVDFLSGTGITPTHVKGAVTITLDNTAVTAGSYTSANITVDAQGRITAASAGGAGTMTSFDVSGDGGTAQTITNGNTLAILGGEGIVTDAAATDKLNIVLDLSELPVRTAAIDGATDYLVGLFDKGADQNKTLIKDLSLSEFGAPTGNLPIGYKLTGVVNPTSAQDAATKNYVDTTFAGSGALIYQGGYDATTAAPSTGVKQGWTYAVTVAGSGDPAGFWSPTLEVGDLVIANIDTPTTAADWTEINKNIDVATATVQGIANFPTAGGLSVSTGAVSMANVGTAGSVGSTSESLAITTDAKGRVTAATASAISITSSQVKDFCNDVQSCVSTNRELTGTIGGASTWDITHNFDTLNVMCEVYENEAPYATVQVRVERVDVNTSRISVAKTLPDNALNYMLKKIG